MTITIKAMTALYNTILQNNNRATETVAKFRDKATAEARLDALASEYNLVWYDAEDGSGLATYTPEEETPDHLSPMIDPEMVDFESLGEFGLGSDEDSAKCPHCAINHRDNGYSIHDAETPAETHTFACLGCGGEWGPAIVRTTKRSPGRLATHAETSVISAIAANPKRKGTKSHARYELYTDGMTVAEAIAAGLTHQDLRWDAERGYIIIAEV